MRRGEVRGAEARRVSRAEVYDKRPRDERPGETSGRARERDATRLMARKREMREGHVHTGDVAQGVPLI